MFEWFSFLELAEDLAERPTSEAAARTAMGRAYYATFHAGRDYLVRANISIDRSRNAHAQVQDALWTESARIGAFVRLLHAWRKQADYDTPSIPDVAEQAQTAAALARETIAAIESLAWFVS